MNDKPDFRHKGSWWHSPSLLEPMPGPWAGYEIYGMETVEAWKRILAWHRTNGLDLLITQIPSHFRDRTIMGWGFQYVLDFKKHPEARTFSADFVRRNAARVEKILDQASKIGITMLIHHYNFMAPKNFVEAHAELLSKWRINGTRPRDADMGSARAVCDRIGTLYGNICWREPVYREFMNDMWDELFQRFPSLGGVLTTPGENQYCLCPDCTRGARNYEPAELLRARESTKHEFLGDFCAAFKAAMERNRRQGVLRLWGIKSAAGEEFDASPYPMGIPYMIKYHWFDAVDTGPDPLIADWMRRGYEVWASDDLWGENAGPVGWCRPEYYRRIIEECRRLGVAAIVSHQNCDWCTASIPAWVQSLNIKSYCHYLAQPADTGTDWIDSEYGSKFGAAGPRVRRAVEKYSLFVLNISKIVKIGGEGYTFGVAHPLFKGVGRIGNRVDAWVRGDLGEIAEYIEHALANGWDSDLFATLNMGERDPFTLLSRMREQAQSAIEDLDRIRPEVPAGVLGDLEWIVTSARLCLHQAMEYCHMCRASVLRAAWKGEKRPSVKADLARRALDEMRAGVEAARLQREDLLELQTSSMDFTRVLRCPGHSSRIMDPSGWFVLEVRERELERLSAELGEPVN